PQEIPKQKEIEVEEEEDEEEEDVQVEADDAKTQVDDDEGSDEVEGGNEEDEQQSMHFKITPIPAIAPVSEPAKTLKRPAEEPAESTSFKKGKDIQARALESHSASMAAYQKQVCWYNY